MTLDELVEKHRRHRMKDYFVNLPKGVQGLIIAVFSALFLYFGYDVVFTENADPPEQVEVVSE